jgi:hypothetical protein
LGGGECNSSIPASELLDDILEYDPVGDTLTVRAAVLPSGRYSHQCAASSATGKIYCLGGVGQSGNFAVYLDEIAAYDPIVDSVALEPTQLAFGGQPGPCFPESGTGRIVCFGMPYSSSFDVTTYDPVSQLLEANGAIIPCMTFPMQSCAPSSSTGNVYCLAGCQGHVVEYMSTPFEPLLQVGEPGDGTGSLANNWSVFSSRAYKTDIEPISDADYRGILTKLGATDVVRYRYHKDVRGVRRMGVIAEDAPIEILSPDGRGVSLSDYAAFLLAGIRGLYEIVQEKDCEIEKLGSEISNLKSQLSDYEELQARLARVEALLSDTSNNGEKP